MLTQAQRPCRDRDDYPQVARMAEEELRQNPYTAGNTVSCDCHRGVVVLYGRVGSYYQKQHAQEAVKRLEGVAGVVNKIEVGS